jgi:hypothetical protein
VPTKLKKISVPIFPLHNLEVQKSKQEKIMREIVCSHEIIESVIEGLVSSQLLKLRAFDCVRNVVIA